MATHYDGYVCLSRDRQHFGFVVFRNVDAQPCEFVCSQWAWEPTDEGRAAARVQMVRAIEREQVADVQPAMRVYA